MSDLTLKLSGLTPLAYEKVKGGWNVIIQFPEKRPVKANPSYTDKGVLGNVLAALNKVNSKGKRLTNAREIVFLPETKHDTSAYMQGMTIDKGTFTVRGISKFIKKPETYSVYNTPEQWARDGREIHTIKYVAPQIPDYESESFVIQKDDKGNPLESTYPIRYVLREDGWVPQLVNYLETNHKPLNGTPSAKEEPKKNFTIVPVVSGERASVAGTWDPANGRPSKGHFWDEKNTVPETAFVAQVQAIEKDKKAYETERFQSKVMAHKDGIKFNGIKGLEKLITN